GVFGLRKCGRLECVKCNVISLNEKARIRNYLAFGVAVMSCGFMRNKKIVRCKNVLFHFVHPVSKGFARSMKKATHC
ncbi:hypothetical protein NUQ48_05925, partial [Glaesserella parasuis]|nr:hypothetical protein [Glaesserella parasuis]